MRGKSTLLLAAALCVALTGCKTTETAFDNDCKVAGTAVGAVLGGVAAGLLLGKGNGRIGTALVGAAAGAFVGNQLGGLLDCRDQHAMASASQAAGDAPVGQRVVWASDTAAVPPPVPSTPPVAVASTPSAQTRPAAVSAPPSRKPASRPKEAITAAPPPPQPAPPPQGTGQWAAVEPIRSGGQSGMWGWVEPVSAPTTTADGRTCRELKQVAVEPSGRQHKETVTSCLDEQRQWVLASR